MGPVINAYPVASNVTFTGSLIVGRTLTGSYQYTDLESNPEGYSFYRWYRADDASGTGEQIISGATSITYVLTVADEDKRILVVRVESAGPFPDQTGDRCDALGERHGQDRLKKNHHQNEHPDASDEKPEKC